MVSLPGAFAQIPRYQLLYSHPSPIEPLENLSRRLASSGESNSPSLWIKREDSNSGLAGGGSKMRKLEYVLPDAQAKNASVLISTGGPQSNHMRQVAAAAARADMKVINPHYSKAEDCLLNRILDSSNPPRRPSQI